MTKNICEKCNRESNRLNYIEEINMRICPTCTKYLKKTVHPLPPYGMVQYDLNGDIICHECGISMGSLASHIQKFHGMSLVDYREKHGLRAKQGLVSLEKSKALRKSMTNRSLMNLLAYQQGIVKNKIGESKYNPTSKINTPSKDSCYIGLEREDGTVLYIYCYVGTPKEIAPILLEEYHHLMLVNQLVLLGDIPKLEPSIYNINPYFSDREPKTIALDKILSKCPELENNYRYIFTKENEWIVRDSRNIFSLNFLVSELL